MASLLGQVSGILHVGWFKSTQVKPFLLQSWIWDVSCSPTKTFARSHSFNMIGHVRLPSVLGLEVQRRLPGCVRLVDISSCLWKLRPTGRVGDNSLSRLPLPLLFFLTPSLIWLLPAKWINTFIKQNNTCYRWDGLILSNFHSLLQCTNISWMLLDHPQYCYRYPLWT